MRIPCSFFGSFLALLWGSTLPASTAQSTLTDTVAGIAELSTLRSHLSAAGLDLTTVVSGVAESTLFAPTNQAFIDLRQQFELEGNGFLLEKLLLPLWIPHNQCFLASHLLGISAPSSALVQDAEFQSLQGFRVTVTSTSPLPVLNSQSPVVQADIAAGSSVIHTIGFPLVPDCIGKNADVQLEEAGATFSIIRRLMDLTGLNTLLQSPGPITVFLPTDDTFERLGVNVTVLEDPANRDSLTVLVGYHVAQELYSLFPTPDSPEVINIRTVPEITLLAELSTDNSHYAVTDFRTTANFTLENLQVNNDILVSNGVAHVIDTIFVPPSVTNFLESLTGLFDTFRTSLVNLNLLAGIEGASGLTIFAPPNDAFVQALPTLRFSLDDTQYAGHQFQLLLNHISMQELRVSEIFNGTFSEVSTLSFQGSIPVDGREIGFVKAGIIEPDISLTTGQVHVVDKVLVPESFLFGLLEVLATLPDHSIFTELLTLAGFQFLNVLGPYTILAPTNDAFDPSLLTFLRNSENLNALLYILLNHILPGNLYNLPNPEAGFSIDSLAPQSLFFYQGTSGFSFVNRATVTNGTFLSMAGNGVIYQVESVMLPLTLADVIDNFGRYDLGGELSTLSTGLQETGLMDTTIRQGGAVTLFAPPDNAFTALGEFGAKFLQPDWADHLTLILLNHVTPGRLNATALSTTSEVPMLSGTRLSVSFDSVNGVVSISNIPVLFPDVKASNRFLHIVGGVFLPPPVTMTFLSSLSLQPEFATLVDLVQQTGLEAELNDAMGGPLTLFAPTNAAFEAADLGDLDSVSLRNLLLYHGVGQNLQLSDLRDGMNLTSTLNETIVVTVTSGVVTLNGNASVDTSIRNQFVANGIYHAIDAVLMLEGLETTAPVPSLSPSQALPLGEPSLMPSMMPSDLILQAQPTMLPSGRPSLVPSLSILPSMMPSSNESETNISPTSQTNSTNPPTAPPVQRTNNSSSHSLRFVVTVVVSVLALWALF